MKNLAKNYTIGYTLKKKNFTFGSAIFIRSTGTSSEEFFNSSLDQLRWHNHHDFMESRLYVNFCIQLLCRATARFYYTIGSSICKCFMFGYPIFQLLYTKAMQFCQIETVGVSKITNVLGLGVRSNFPSPCQFLLRVPPAWGS